MEQKTTVVIVGAGPAGLAASACLNRQNIPNIVLEREDIYASLWKKRAYDRLKLHLAKEFCELPYQPYPPAAPTYIPKRGFIQYLDEYVSNLHISPLYHRQVVSAAFDESGGNWVIVAENTKEGTTERFLGKFLVVATGENSEGLIPPIPGLDSFSGEVLHSNKYGNGEEFRNKDVLVIGCGNSGMEIAYDLSNYGARTSIVIRSPTHVLNEWLVRLGMVLVQYIPLKMVDRIVVMLGLLKYGNLSELGITRPEEGPFFLKKERGKAPVIDVGTIAKIRAGNIDVYPAVEKVKGDRIHFKNGDMRSFDAIVCATGYRSTVRKWLKDDGGLFGEDGMPRKNAPIQWKGDHGLYCVGFARAGLFGISKDAMAISKDVKAALSTHPN